MEYDSPVFTANTTIPDVYSVRLSIVYLHSIQLSKVSTMVDVLARFLSRTLVLTGYGSIGLEVLLIVCFIVAWREVPLRSSCLITAAIRVARTRLRCFRVARDQRYSDT